MYGRPKLIEFERIKSPSFTYLDFLAPSLVIFSSVCVMKNEFGSTSPILIQLTPSDSFVI